MQQEIFKPLCKKVRRLPESFSGPHDIYVTSENQTNKYLTTALHYAAQRGHVDASSGTGDEKIGTTIVSDLQ